MVPSDAPKADALPEYPLTYTDEIRVEKLTSLFVKKKPMSLFEMLVKSRLRVSKVNVPSRLVSTVLTVKRLTARVVNEETLAP